MSLTGSVCRGGLWLLFKLLHVFYVPLYIARIFQRPQKCPPVRDPVLFLSATAIAEKIRNQEIKCVSVIRSYIRRIQEVNPVINAVVEDRFQEAIKDAEKVDNLISSGTLQSNFESFLPLLGVPITVKESIAVKDLSHNAGCMVKNRPKACTDAEVVSHAKRAGAIPLLVSNTPELCMNWETNNKITGKTSNPYDTTKTPGGSSGGEASLLASAASVIGLGSDICGSLRLPAHFCGVWGHKPSPGAVSSKGHYPDCSDKDAWRSYFTLGPMARYAEDLPLLLGCIAGPEGGKALRLHEKVNLNAINIYYINTFNSILVHSIDPEVSNCVSKVARHFQNKFDKLPLKLKIPNFCYAPEYTFMILARIYGVDYINDAKTEAWAEAGRYVTCRSRSMGLTVAYGLLKQGTGLLSKGTRRESAEVMREIREGIVESLGENGVLLFPAFTSAAHYHDDIVKKVFDTAYTAVFNVLGLPVTNCPVGVDRRGLPVGVQVVGSPNCDRLTLAVAQEIQRAFGGWIPPPTV